jgi:uncharacterized protein YlaN (UPF0358 family)
MPSSDIMLTLIHKSITVLQDDAIKIQKLIEVQMENLSTRKCPLYEEVLDTQMYGLSKEVEFAVKVGLISELVGKEIVNRLQRDLDELYEAMEKNNERSSQ